MQSHTLLCEKGQSRGTRCDVCPRYVCNLPQHLDRSFMYLYGKQEEVGLDLRSQDTGPAILKVTTGGQHLPDKRHRLPGL